MTFIDVLKKAVAEGRKVEEVEGVVKVEGSEGSEVFKKDEESGVEGYDVGSVLFCWNNREATVTEYIEKCSSEGVKVIPFMERTKLIELLSGERNDNNEEENVQHEKRKNEKVDYRESKRKKIENDELLKEISKHEIELIDHDKALRGTEKNIDFSNLIRECEYKIVRALKKPEVKNKKENVKERERERDKGKSGKSGSGSGNNNTINKDPIIILSPSAISMLTMGNIKGFLEEGKFEDPSKCNNNSDLLHIRRDSKKFKRVIKFVVVKNVENFFVKPEYWDRVVAVFTTGQEWQFKKYKINDPNELFQKVKGFYVNYNGDIVPNNVKRWNVEIISLDRNQRFRDRQISELMWESIERFMLVKGYK